MGKHCSIYHSINRSAEKHFLPLRVLRLAEERSIKLKGRSGEGCCKRQETWIGET